MCIKKLNVQKLDIYKYFIYALKKYLMFYIFYKVKPYTNLIKQAFYNINIFVSSIHILLENKKITFYLLVI